MTSQEIKLAVLESRVGRLEARLKGMDEKLGSIVTTLDQMSGGKKALLGLCTLIGMFIGSVVGIITALKYWKGV